MNTHCMTTRSKSRCLLKMRQDNNKYNVYVFDLDNTLYLHMVNDECKLKYNKKVKDFMIFLKSKNKKLCIATHHRDPNKLLIELGINDLLDIVVYETRYGIYNINEFTKKSDMIKSIQEKLGCKRDEIIFFDDFAYNIKNVSEINVKSVLVSEYLGINFDEYVTF